MSRSATQIVMNRQSGRLLSILTILVCSCLIFMTAKVSANVFAAQLNITNPDGSPFDGDFTDGSGASLSFFLNDTASTVTVEIIETGSGTVVATINGGAMSRGMNAVAWDGSGSAMNVEYSIRVTAEQSSPSTTEWTVIWDSGDIDIFTRGMAINNDQSDPDFGKIFTSNDGGPLGTGINIYNADGSFHDPFLVAADVTSGGTITYGSDAPVFAVMDQQGRLYVSAVSNGEVIRINRDYSATVLMAGLSSPKGLYVEGDGADFTIYVSADNRVLRADIGVADTFDVANAVVEAEFTGFFPHQLMLDDEGFMYATLRQSNSLGSDGRGIRKWDISGATPVVDADALWFMNEDRTFIANDLLMDYGSDRNSASDDVLYYTTRAGGGNDQDGVWQISDINSFFPDTVRIVTEDDLYGADDNINARAAIDFDAAGNIVLMENSNEHVFFLAPPATGPTNSFTTTSAVTFMIGVTAIGDNNNPLAGYALKANYPNPFNPATNIEYKISDMGYVELVVYDMLGKKVRTLVSENKAAGEYKVIWDGRSEAGMQVSSGTYLVRMRAGKFVQSRRMILAK